MPFRFILWTFFTLNVFGYNQQEQCFDMINGTIIDASFNFESHTNGLYLNGKKFNLKAASWFGFETCDYVVHGLWAVSYQSLVSFLSNYSFNAVRLPFSAYVALNNPPPTDIINYNYNADLQGKSSLQIMDIIINALGNSGILVMLDMHDLECGANSNDGLWYDSTYSETKTLSAWNALFERYKNQWNIISIDVFNEPFDATWGTGNDKTDFDYWCTKVGNQMYAQYQLEWLVLCEGTANGPPCTPDGCFWGEDLQGVKTKAVTLQNKNKIVYAPHVYGPSVFNMPYFSANNFPANMPGIWNTHFGFIRNMTKLDAALSVGEWGGEMSGTDQVWMNAFGQYLIDIDAKDTWFWCLNPNSGDTGGLLENDWKTPVIPKLNLLQKIQPNPTKVNPQHDDRVCTI